MAEKWAYGDAWERFPIEPGEIWQAGPNRVMVVDIVLDPLPILNGQQFAMSYTDPPYTEGSASAFYTKADIQQRATFRAIVARLIDLAADHSPACNYMEMGNQHLQATLHLLMDAGATSIQFWDTTYYRRAPTNLIRFAFGEDAPATKADYSGKDDESLPAIVIQDERPQSVVDYCCGKGLTGRSAFFVSQAPFVGIELNKRRLAHLLDFYSRNGLEPARTDSRH